MLSFSLLEQPCVCVQHLIYVYALYIYACTIYVQYTPIYAQMIARAHTRAHTHTHTRYTKIFFEELAWVIVRAWQV